MRTIKMNPGMLNVIGRAGENLAVQARFRVAEEFSRLYGTGIFALCLLRPDETEPYAVQTQLDGADLIWNVSATDTEKQGYAQAELRYYAGDTLAKSVRYRCFIEPSVGQPSEDPPEPWQSWVDEVLEAGAAAKEAAETAQGAADRAEAATVHAPYIGENNNWYVWSMDQEQYVDTGVYSGGQPPYIGENGHWYVGTEDTGVDARGPQGPPGIQGPAGADGADGKSAYEAAQDGGYTGTEAQFNAALAGVDGLETDVQNIEDKIPFSASSTNKLVSASEMGDAIEAVEAKQLYATTKQGSFATKAELTAATTFYNADGTVATPTKNDVAYVLADESHDGKSAKYVIASVDPIVWGFVITFSDAAFTQAQMDAINSGATQEKISSIADKLDKEFGTEKAGQFLIVGEDGFVTTVERAFGFIDYNGYELTVH